MHKRTKVLLLSMVIICLSVAVVVGGTYSLFTGEVTVNNHLKAGNLQVGLERTSFTQTVLSDDGILKPETDNTTVDLTKDNNPVFNIENAVPTAYYEAEVKVTNKGTVAFNYGVAFIFNKDNNATEIQKDFASQINITVTCGDKTETFLLSEAANKKIDLGILLTGKNNSFKIKASFKDLATNNDVQGKELEFDLQVYATQATTQE